MTPISRFSLPIVALATTAVVLANPIVPEATSIGDPCTSTTYQAGNIAPAPPATWQPTWTVTLHTATTTSTVAVDCGGCSHLQTDKVMINYQYPSGPHPMAIETVVAPEPAVVTVAHCASPPPNQPAAPPPPPGPEMTPAPAAAAERRQSGQDDNDDKGPTTSCVKHLFHAPHFTWGPTRTVWTSTTTVTTEVNCGGCEKLQVDYLPFGPGPVVFFNTTVTATTASTTTVPVCGGTGTEGSFGKRAVVGARTRSPHYYQAPELSVHTATPVGGPATPTCTTHKAVEAEVPNQTFTTYPSTVTATTSVDCGGCALEWSTPVLYFFAPIVFTATATAANPSTSVELACAAPTGGAYQAPAN